MHSTLVNNYLCNACSSTLIRIQAHALHYEAFLLLGLHCGLQQTLLTLMFRTVWSFVCHISTNSAFSAWSSACGKSEGGKKGGEVITQTQWIVEFSFYLEFTVHVICGTTHNTIPYVLSFPHQLYTHSSHAIIISTHTHTHTWMHTCTHTHTHTCTHTNKQLTRSL